MAGTTKPARRFFIIDDNLTRSLATAGPPWGAKHAAGGDFFHTRWQDLAPILIGSLARHEARTLDPAHASVCVVAAPLCARQGPQHRKLTLTWRRSCPRGVPIAVIDGADPDLDNGEGSRCPALWDACRVAAEDELVRVSGSTARMLDVAKGLRRGLCRALAVPYVAHYHSTSPAPAVAPWERAPSSSSSSFAAAAAAPPKARTGGEGVVTKRRVKAAHRAAAASRRPLIAAAFAVWGHNGAEAHGFNAWRRALRNACTRAANCSRVWVSMGGKVGGAGCTRGGPLALARDASSCPHHCSRALSTATARDARGSRVGSAWGLGASPGRGPPRARRHAQPSDLGARRAVCRRSRPCSPSTGRPHSASTPRATGSRAAPSSTA